MNERPVVGAAKDGDASAIERLIGAGADVNERDEHGWTPLNWAAGNGNRQIVRQLLSLGADVTLTGRDNRTPLMIARAANRQEVVELLTEAEKARGVWQDPLESRRYCRAYPVAQLREFSGWEPDDSAPLQEDDIVYLHQDFSVTRSIWHGEDVVFSSESPEWKAFCTRALGFEIPADLL